MPRVPVALFAAFLCSALVFAATPETDAIKQRLSKILPDTTINAIRPSSIPGLYEVELDTQLVYVSTDGKFLLLGDMIDVATRDNLTENWRDQTAVRLIDAVGDKNMIVMGPDKPKRTITVFTDVDCPYCAKLHLDVPALNRAGVRVRYLLYPRNGVNSPTFQRSVSIWCAADRVKAVGIAKAGGAIDSKTCDNPVQSHFNLGQRLGISGTPTIYLDNGRKLPGYVPADRLLALLELNGVSRSSHAN